MVAAATTVDPRTRLRAIPGNAVRLPPYRAKGAARDLFYCTDREVLLAGPAGTGKSLSCLKKLDRNAIKYPGSRQLMVRKTRTSLTQTAQVTFEKQVIVAGGTVRFHTTQQAYLYPNGSKIIVGGLDKSSKVMSSEYDTIYVMEATELTESDWEDLTTRLRNGVIPHQQLIADCNPDAETHWLNIRCNAGKTTRLFSRHEDNPYLWDEQRGQWTERGQPYMAILDSLSGVRYKRLRLGLWVAAEGQVYEGWDPAMHVVDPYEIPYQWPRYWVIDFGFVHPFVWQAWAMKPDGELVMYREIYMTRRLVSDHAKHIMHLAAGEPRPTAIITDHDAEDRATLEAETGYATMAAIKNVSAGIQAVANRLRPAHGIPRLAFMRDAIDERDKNLLASKLPTSTIEEFPSYVWNRSANRNRGEEPVKEFDHGMDSLRYLTAYFDLNGNYDDESDDVIAQMNRELA